MCHLNPCTVLALYVCISVRHCLRQQHSFGVECPGHLRHPHIQGHKYSFDATSTSWPRRALKKGCWVDAVAFYNLSDSSTTRNAYSLPWNPSQPVQLRPRTWSPPRPSSFSHGRQTTVPAARSVSENHDSNVLELISASTYS